MAAPGRPLTILVSYWEVYLRLTVALSCVVVALTATSTAQAKLLYPFKKHDSAATITRKIHLNLKHTSYICDQGTGKVKQVHCRATRWLENWLQKLTTPYVDSCTMALLGREGGMNPHATNPTTGAYGGPQALPGSKMASAGADWRDNIWTQIKWMIGYENKRWGSPCAALAHSYTYGWY